MSRAHMLYDDRPLESVPVTVKNWETTWEPNKIFRFNEGNGVLLEGRLQERSRFSITEPNSGTNKRRYVVLHIEIVKAHKRVFDDGGKEVEPNFGTTKKVSTGFLMSSYKTCAAGESDKLSPGQVKQLISISNIEELTDEKTQKFKNCIAFWCKEKDLDSLELFPGDHVRIKTRGSGPYIEFITKIDDESSTVSNYTGGQQTGSSWTQKVMSFKGYQPLPQDQQEGVDEDEWDD